MTNIYNITGVENSNNLLEVFSAVNVMSGGLFVTVVILFTFYVVLLMSLYKWLPDFKDLILACNSIISVITLAFWSLSLVNNTVFTIVVVLWVISLLVKLFSDN